MDMTLIDWPSAIGQVVLVVIVAFVAMCAITSLVRFQLVAEHTIEAEELGTSIDREFRVHIMNQIAYARRERQPISVMMLRLPEVSPPTEDVVSLIKERLRATDVVNICGERCIGMLLICGSEKTPAVADRLIQQLTGVTPGVEQWRFGVAGYPDHGYKTSVIYHRALDMQDEAAKQNKRIVGMLPPEETETEDSGADTTMKDPHTGLVSEEKMILVMRRYVARERKADHPVSMIYFDVDQPERLEEIHGEGSVHAMVKELAGLLDNNCREKDMLARFGAAGFILGMNAPPDMAVQTAQRMMQDVRKVAFKAGRGMKISISAGVAGYPDVLGTAVQYFVAAEAALRHARLRGRNQCLKYDHSMNARLESDKTIDHL